MPNSINLSLTYNYADNPFMPFIKKEGDVFIETSENYKWKKDLFPKISIKVDPFNKQWLRFSFNYTLQYFENKLNYYNSLTSNSIYTNISINYKKVIIEYYYYLGGKSLFGEYIITNESSQHIQLSYKFKNLGFSFGVLQPFSKSIFYKSELVKSSVLCRYSTSDIYDNGRMFLFKFTYNFSFGKKASETDIKLYNKDYDSGVFKPK